MGTTERVISGIFAIGFAGATVAVAVFDPNKTSIFPACPTLSMTGYACPGCGLTRGFHALFHGEFREALDYNAMIPVYLFGLLYLFASLVLTAVRGRGLGIGKFPVWSVYALLAAAAVFTVVRNLPWEPFSVLYP